MNTPDTLAGRLTEKIMFRITDTLEIKPHTYNPIYSAILETLQQELSVFDPDPVLPMSQSEYAEFLRKLAPV